MLAGAATMLATAATMLAGAAMSGDGLRRAAVRLMVDCLMQHPLN
jgi:hypothetical protein